MMDNNTMNNSNCYRTTYMDQLIPAMYDQWSDPEINFDDIVNESFYRSSVSGSGYNNNGDDDVGTEQSNDFNTCSLITKNEFNYDENYDHLNDVDYDDEEDDEVTITAENTSLEYTNSNYGFIPYLDAMQQNSMVTSYTSTMIWHSKGAAANLKMYHIKDGIESSSSSSNNNTGGLSSHLSGDAIPFVPIAQSTKASKSTF